MDMLLLLYTLWFLSVIADNIGVSVPEKATTNPHIYPKEHNRCHYWNLRRTSERKERGNISWPPPYYGEPGALFMWQLSFFVSFLFSESGLRRELDCCVRW